MTTFSEQIVAQTLGLSEREVARLRKSNLVKGTHWTLEKNADGSGGIVFTEDGLRSLEAVLDIRIDYAALNKALREATQPPTPEKTAPAETALFTLVIERLCPNPTWIMARVDGELVPVLVPNNRLLRPGVTLERCQRVAADRFVWLDKREVMAVAAGA